MIKPYFRGQEPRVRVGPGWVFSFVIGQVECDFKTNHRLLLMNALTISYTYSYVYSVNNNFFTKGIVGSKLRQSC